MLDSLTIGILVYLPAIVIGGIATLINDTLGAIVLVLLYVLAIPLVIYVWAWLPGITGQTPGKRIMGIEVVKYATGQYLGGWGHIGRMFAQMVNSLACYLGWFWPLWDKDNQSLADKIVSSQVVMGKKGGLFPIFPDGKPF